MSIQHKDILNVALHLAVTPGEEYLRSAVSRAYYSVLHGALIALPDDRQPNRSFNGSTHEAVLSEVKAYVNARTPLPGRSAAIRVAEILGRLKQKRKIADYRLTEAFDEKSAARAIEEAKVALADCDEWLKKRLGEKA